MVSVSGVISNSGIRASGGAPPQKQKPKNGLDASRKAFGDVECQVCPSEPTLNLCIILVHVGMLQPVCY